MRACTLARPAAVLRFRSARSKRRRSEAADRVLPLVPDGFRLERLAALSAARCAIRACTISSHRSPCQYGARVSRIRVGCEMIRRIICRPDGSEQAGRPRPEQVRYLLDRTTGRADFVDPDARLP